MIRSNPHPQSSRRPGPLYMTSLLLPATAAMLTLGSCNDETKTTPPPPQPVTDTAPVGDGLKVIGFAMLGAAVVIALGRMAR